MELRGQGHLHLPGRPKNQAIQQLLSRGLEYIRPRAELCAAPCTGKADQLLDSGWCENPPVVNIRVAHRRLWLVLPGAMVGALVRAPFLVLYVL